MARILAGCLRFTGPSGPLLLKTPSREARYLAEEAYADAFGEARADGVMDETALLAYLVETGDWSDEDEGLLNGLPKEIEDFKVRLFEASLKPAELAVTRKALATAKAKLEELWSRRHSQDHLSCAGIASLRRARYLLACSVHTLSGQPVFGPEWASDCAASPLLESAALAKTRGYLPEPFVRELARTNPWRQVWNCRKADAFGLAPADYSDDQLRLASYSNLYDSVYDHPECPADDVVGDDDRLDGWMIAQRRKKKAEEKRSVVEGLLGEKVSGCPEIFLPVRAPDLPADWNAVGIERGDVDAMNGPDAAAAKRMRLALLFKKGRVEEADMPDTKRKIMRGQA